MPLERISITIPKDVLEAADRRAGELDRSRSWVVVDALRRYLGSVGAGRSEGQPARVVREVAPILYVAGEVTEARLRHLRAELALTPSERLRRAEELGSLARQAQRRGRRQQAIGFESYEDFYEWKKRRLIGG